MKKSKVFLIIAIIFIAIIIAVMVDMARKTTFPGGKNKQNEAAPALMKEDTTKIE